MVSCEFVLYHVYAGEIIIYYFGQLYNRKVWINLFSSKRCSIFFNHSFKNIRIVNIIRHYYQYDM